LPALGQDPATDRQVITILQQQLLTLGYLTAVTGHISHDTRAAITEFSIAHDVSLDGPDTDRIIAIDAAYEAQRLARVVPTPVEPEPEIQRYDVVHQRSRVPIVVGASAAVLLGLGFVGVAMRESVITGYNARCRGFGDPTPAAGCDEAMNSAGARGATVLATVGFVAGGLTAVVAAVLFVRTTRSRIACGGGPGDVGVACGGRF
jgi:hypothetical protein